MSPPLHLPPLRFASAATSPLRLALHDAAQQHLAQHDTHRFADGWLALKLIFLLGAAALAYGMALVAPTHGQFFAAYAAFVFLAMLLAMNTLHDAAHGAVFRSGRLNRWWMRLVSIPVGIDAAYWTTRHVHFHHTYANIDGYDLDTEPNAFLRQTPFQCWAPQYQYQHLYWPLIAALSLPYLVWYSDWMDMWGKTKLSTRTRPQGLLNGLAFVGTKIAHVALVLVVPWWCMQSQGAGLGWPELLLYYVLAQMVASCVLVALILGTHWAEVEFFQPPPNGKIPHTWHEHAFVTSCDWRPRPAWLGYWFGGLNSHLTHHLFPTYSHRHYPALSKIVAQVAREQGLSYRELNYSQLMASQQKFLKSMGRRPTA